MSTSIPAISHEKRMLTPEQKIKKLTKKNDELENYFGNTIIPQLFIDANLILRKFTPPAMKQFSLSLGDIGRSVNDIKENFRFPNIVDNIQHVIDTREILEKEIQTTDFRWYQMNIIPYVSIRKYKVDGVIMTFVEITRRVQDLKIQERLISDHETLLDTISHDIKGPIGNLLLAIELFKRVSPSDPSKFQPLLHNIDSSISKIQQIISDLTDTRKQEYRYKSEEELLSFEHIFEDVRFALNDQIIQSGAVVNTEINVSEITFSRRKLRSIIYNLVSNAIKFKSPDRQPEIMVKTSVEKDFVLISVVDNGIGVDKSKQEIIFDKYFRLNNDTEGSGIGLYLIKEIVSNAGGKIVLDTARERGSEFKVFLRAEAHL